MSINLFYVTDQILIETEYNCTISMATAGASLPGDAGELAAEDRSESVGADHELVSQRGPGHDVHVCLAQDPHQQSLPVLIPQLLNTPTHSGLDCIPDSPTAMFKHGGPVLHACGGICCSHRHREA